MLPTWLSTPLRVAVFFVFCCYGWLLFRARSFDQIEAFTARLFGFGAAESSVLAKPSTSAVLGIVALAVLQVCDYRAGRLESFKRWSIPLQGLLYSTIIFILIMGTSNAPVQFIYFQFGVDSIPPAIGPCAASPAPIVGAGWPGQECDVGTAPVPSKIGFDIYGMSFTNRIADEMERLDNELASQRFGGPAAPPNHSYACFLRRFAENRTLAPVQIIGVLASSVRRMETVTGLTTSFEGPMPFTYPRYSLTHDGHLEGRMPSIRTEDDLRSALADPQKW